jgi:hypothetical protein
MAPNITAPVLQLVKPGLLMKAPLRNLVSFYDHTTSFLSIPWALGPVLPIFQFFLRLTQMMTTQTKGVQQLM